MITIFGTTYPNSLHLYTYCIFYEAIVTIENNTFETFVSESEIRSAVHHVAARINEDYQGKSPVFLSILNGSFMFMADLMKSIELNCSLSFIKLSSYEANSSTGNVKQLIGLQEDITDKDVIVVEDIVDTGNTIQEVYDLLDPYNPKSISVATFLFKPTAYQKQVKIDYIGLTIENVFVVGYGLDYNGWGRNYNSLYKLNENNQDLKTTTIC